MDNAGAEPLAEPTATPAPPSSGADRRLPTAVSMLPYQKDDASRLERATVSAFAEAGFASLVADPLEAYRPGR